MRDTISRGQPRFLARLVALAAGLLSGEADAARAASWEPVGPTDVAMITVLAAGRSAVYAATCNGVYRSDDGASSWQEAGLQRRCVVRLAVDPRGDADTLYAIVDVHAFASPYPEPSFQAAIDLHFDVLFGSTLWVSRDGARTWTQTSADRGNAVAVDLTEPETAYLANAGALGPLAVTHDSGATWTRVPDAPDRLFSRLAIDPRDGVLYGADGSLSTYSGGAWSLREIPVSRVATGSGSDGAVYAAGVNTFCRKTNAADWLCNAVPGISPLAIVELPESPPQGRRILLANFDGVWSSDDGGASFARVAGDPEGFTPAAAADPSGAAIYAGNDLGVYRSADRGATWTKSSAGLRSTWVRALALDPAHPSTIWAGAEGRVYDVFQFGPGVFRSTDGGESWTPASVDGEPGHVFSLGIDPSNPQNVFTASFGRAHRTANGGATWTETGTGSFQGFVHALAVDPDSSRVWAAAESGLKTSTNGGGSWSPALQDKVYSLLFDSRRPGTLYAGGAWEDVGSYYPYGAGFAVLTSRDAGVTWLRAGGAVEGAVTALATDPFSDRVVFAGTYAGTILRSPDAGATWERWDTENPGYAVFALAADPVRAGRLYFGGWGGVWRSRDAGRTWDLFAEGLEPLGVFGLALSPDGRWLYAGTTGGGVFRRDLASSERAPVEPVGGSRPTREVIRP
jgi:photosystem II stability/assembly factor-like uncharacterized protein